MTIRFIRPTVPPPEAWLPHLQSSYEQRFFTNFGPAARRLEAAFEAKYGGPDRQAILVASCTAGLTAVLCAAGVSGRVVVPAFTFPATAQAVLQSGCRPVFCDVSRETWELDPVALDSLLTRQPASAVVHVRSFGFCRDIHAIEAVASRHGAPVIVDGAAALGGRLEAGAWVGGQGQAEVFSMHATKVFGIGEGGVVFSERRHAARIRQACNFGLAGGDVVMPGLNGKLSDFHAAVGLALLDRIEGYIRRRHEVAKRYAQALRTASWAQLPDGIGDPPMQSYPILVESASLAEALLPRCLDEGLELRRYYRPLLPRASAFSAFESGPTDVAADLADRMVCLPVYSDMTDEEADFVIAAVHRAVRG